MYSNKRCRFHGTHIIIFCCLLLSLTAAETSNSRRVHTLTLVREYKLTDCLDTQPNVDFEASGIISVGNELYVCFDNMPAVAIVDRELSVCANSSARIIHLPQTLNEHQKKTSSLSSSAFAGRQPDEPQIPVEIGFEAISMYHNTFVVVQEIDVHHTETSTSHQARVKTYTTPLFETKLSDSLLHWHFNSENKGIEGVAVVSVGSYSFLLALCEGNHCKAGDEGQDKGHGIILVYYHNNSKKTWMYNNNQIHLPVPFTDFSGMDVRTRKEEEKKESIMGRSEIGGEGGMGTENERRRVMMVGDIAVVSQESRGLFLGQYMVGRDETKPSGYSFNMMSDMTLDMTSEMTSSSSAALYTFPKEYCNIEGVTFLENGDIGVVSDKRKRNQDQECSVKDQSVHVFHVSDTFMAFDEEEESMLEMLVQENRQLEARIE